jgi:hypothetical protein
MEGPLKELVDYEDQNSDSVSGDKIDGPDNASNCERDKLDQQLEACFSIRSRPPRLPA